MKFKIINNSDLSSNIEDMIQNLTVFAKDRLGFEQQPSFHQNEQGFLSNQGYNGPGYAQKNPHLRNMEKEAYLKGNMCFRDWEDSYKATNYNERGNNMSLKEWKNQQLNERLMKKWFNVSLNEGVSHEDSEERDDHYKGAAEDDYAQIAKLKKDAHYDAEKDLEEGSKAYKRDEDYEPLMEEDEIQEGSGDRGDDDREQSRDAGRTFKADSGGQLEEKVFKAVMKILKGK